MTRVDCCVAALAAVLLSPAALFGQDRAASANGLRALRVTPIVGADFVSVGTRDLGGSGILAAVRLGLPLGEDLRLVAEVGRAEANDVGRWVPLKITLSSAKITGSRRSESRSISSPVIRALRWDPKREWRSEGSRRRKHLDKRKPGAFARAADFLMAPMVAVEHGVGSTIRARLALKCAPFRGHATNSLLPPIFRTSYNRLWRYRLRIESDRGLRLAPSRMIRSISSSDTGSCSRRCRIPSRSRISSVIGRIMICPSSTVNSSRLPGCKPELVPDLLRNCRAPLAGQR